MIDAPDVLGLYNALEKLGVKIWIDGGWGVDALLEKETRPHEDLDIAIQQKDISKLRELLERRGFQEIKLEIARPHNFVMADTHGHEIDVHAIVLDSKGDGIYGPVENGELNPAPVLPATAGIAGQKITSILPR